MRKMVMLCACMMFLSLGAFAQRTGEAYFGFSELTSGKSGWNGDLGLNIGKPIVLEGDLGGYYSHGEDIHSFMGGVKLQGRYRKRGFNPWGRFLFGGSHTNKTGGDTARSWALGGGVDANVYRKFGLRLTADAFHTRFFDSGTLRLRIGAGLVYHF